VPRACFYCGAPAEALDHGIPLWLPSLVGLAGEPVEHLVAGETPPREPEGPADQLPTSIPRHAALGDAQPDARLVAAIESAITERASLAIEEYSVRTLCRGCAAALAALDELALPLLEPMVTGGARAFDAAEQRVLAAWGARAAYAVLAVERKALGVPRSHRSAVRDRGEPHENVFVGFGRYRASNIGVLAGRLLLPLDADKRRRDVEAYSVLAVFGHLVVKVFGIRRRPARTSVRPPQGEMIRLWPTHAERLEWPPLWGLSPQTLEHAFTQVPFYRPFRYSEVRYRGPGVKTPVRHRRTEGLRGRQ
jgi:hypothetical protein